MYLPASFRVTDLETLWAFMEAESFAALVTVRAGLPFASHVPILLDRHDGPHGALRGHFARANPHPKDAHGQPTMAIFSGPHAYVSPTWYQTPDTVPTWNFIAVHATGPLEIHDDLGFLRTLLADQVARYEAGSSEPWNLPPDGTAFYEKLLTQIVGFRLPIAQLEGKWKLNQNHPRERQERVAAALAAQSHLGSQDLAARMRARLESDAERRG